MGVSLWTMEAHAFELFTPEQYLEDEMSREVRHEYIGGTVHAMGGATRRHNRLAFALARHLESRKGSGPCQVYLESVKVRVRTVLGEHFYYPDVMVGCDPEDAHELYLEHPSIIVEVLSPSSREIDRGQKLLAYQTIPSLRHYLIVSQDERKIEWLRRDGNAWEVVVLTEAEDRLEFPELGVSASLEEIYQDVVLG